MRPRHWASAGAPPTGFGRSPEPGSWGSYRHKSESQVFFARRTRRFLALSIGDDRGQADLTMATWDPRANEVFLKAAEFSFPEERRHYLDRACASDAALRAEVEALLDANARAGS